MNRGLLNILLVFALIVQGPRTHAFGALNRAVSAGLVMDEAFSVNSGAEVQHMLNKVFYGKGELAGVECQDARMMGFSGASVREVKCQWMGADHSLPNKVFIKNIILEPPKNANEDALFKWRRNRLSYLNEITFLEQYAPTLRGNGANIPDVYKVLHQGTPEGEGDSVESFLFVSESMSRSGIQQVIEFEDAQFKSALRWLARLHGSYQGMISEGGGKEGEDVWREGTHLALSKRPPKELVSLPENWQKFCEAFGWPAFGGLGARVAAIAPKIAAQLSPLGGEESSECLPLGAFTLVHGDAKPANLFFAEREGMVDTFAIDFQWSGWGIASTDIIYLIATGLCDSHVNSLDLDKDVLKVYHEALIEELGKRRVPPAQHTTYEELTYHFQLATIDYVRWIMACRLPGDTPAKFAKRKEEMDPNLGSYRRSEAMMIWLLSTVENFLPKVEARLK